MNVITIEFECTYTCAPIHCDSNGNITVNCKFTFHGSVPRNYFGDSSLESATISSKTSILDEYEKLLGSAKFSDVTIVVGEKKFPAHMNILAARSPVFSAMFEHDMLESKKKIVKISDVKPEIMTEVLRFIYSSKVKNLTESTTELLAAADKY
ncbi:hypothetical protein TSAR_013222 [Trichomalopsis sarcophagae]|uniref:BTB domain-containing protein n=1 Tax=Trichomalopsis sarcophagae TaxID=543379 RepID=A0A232FJ36_9HYME|nr:hypothetical protein TSAR_013222 [Trichomalopsis sarcophagae]